MSDKTEFRGDVAQAIVGNVHEAPRLSNVVNFHMVGEEKQIETLTYLQKRTIAEAIGELCSITGEEPLSAYRVILADFGATKIKLMPRDKFPEIKAQLKQWVDEARSAQKKVSLDGAQVSTAMSTASASASSGLIAECVRCTEKDRSYIQLQRQSRWQWVLVAALSIACGFMLYKTPMAADASIETKCYFDGRPYSVGSTITAAGRSMRECLLDADTHSVIWGRVN